MSRRVFLAVWVAWCAVVAAVPVDAQTVKTKPAPAKPAAAKSAPATATPAKPAAPAAATAVASSGMKLGRLASDECVLFLACNGSAKSDPASTNKTEQLWAEESVRDFIQQLRDEVQKVIAAQASGDENASVAAAAAPVLLDAVIGHPLAVSLNSFTTTSPPVINLSVVVDTEGDAAKVREALGRLVKLAPQRGGESLAEETIEGSTFYRPAGNGDDTPLPQFGMYKSFLILTLGQTTTADTIQKINGSTKSPKWLEETLSEFKVDRPSMLWHLDVQAVWKMVDSLIDEPKVRQAFKASGLFDVKRIAAVSGLDATASVDRMSIETIGAPKGLLALLPDKPLTASDLKMIPANPAQASIIRFDLGHAVESILKIADEIDPMPREQFEQFSAQVEPMLGFSIEDDLLAAFGDVWATYVSGSEAGGGMVPGFVIAATVKDQPKLSKVLDSLVAQAKGFLQQQGPQAPVTILDFTAKGAKGYRVQINNLPIPVSPAWVVTKDQFVIGMSPQLVTAHISAATAKTSLADNDSVKAGLKIAPQPLMISYRDPRPEIQGLYTMVNMFSPIVSGQLQQQGIEFNLPPLPPYSEIEPFLAPSVSTLSRTANGWRSESHGVVPSFAASSPAVAGVLVALLLPAVQQAREAARRTQGKNNLKQIALAMHNYHDTFNSFPERVVLDKQGKPGLSWRVKLLPYLDQAALYNEFHMDEPWDSDHNKTLIERMPSTYSFPGDEAQRENGKTRYVVLAGKGTLFDGKTGTRMADVTDGSSNTIMTVEANADSAVIWTKPDDLNVDFTEPLKGLKGARVGGFQAVLADGSVRFISENIDITTLKALFSRAGGEVIGDF